MSIKISLIVRRAFTATECVETQWAIAGHTLIDLSVQEFISCSKSSGCSGGNTMAALTWLQQGVGFLSFIARTHVNSCVPWIPFLLGVNCRLVLGLCQWNDVLSPDALLRRANARNFGLGIYYGG